MFFVCCLIYYSAIITEYQGAINQITFNYLLQSKCAHWKNVHVLLNDKLSLTATFQPNSNIEKLCQMAFNGNLSMPSQTVFLESKSLHVEDSLANFNHSQFI